MDNKNDTLIGAAAFVGILLIYGIFNVGFFAAFLIGCLVAAIIGICKSGIDLKSIGVIAVLVLFIIALMFACQRENKSSSSRWNSLTKEEQKWYERNYGGGKSEAYDDAIENYRGY